MTISVVIPAHNEERVLGRLLDGLLAEASPGELEVVVVCNGCTDGTALIAAGRGPAVRVVELPTPSKHEAMRFGDQRASAFPRVYLDADVEVRTSDVRALAAVVAEVGPVLASAPRRQMALAGCHWTVRWFYEVWLRIPGVRDGLYGRGVVALSEDGWRRVAELPPLMADDLAVSALFAGEERRIVEQARVVIHPPRTWGDLVRRRVRAATSTSQFEQSGTVETRARTSKADLVGVLRERPWLAPQVVLFVVVAVVARRRARRAVRDGDFRWLRDASSREG